MSSTTDTRALTFDTITTDDAFAALAGTWDDLVRAMPRPSPALLHGWLRAWWQHYGDKGKLAVHVAFLNGRLVGALPLCVRPRFGFRVLTFLGGDESALADLLLTEGASPSVGETLAERAVSHRHDFADLFGLPGGSRLATALGSSRLRLIERSEAPVMDLSAGWEALYHSKMSSRQRSRHRRRRKLLGELGLLEVGVAGTSEELGPALEDAFAVNALRWRGRPDRSQFGTATGMAFHREAIQALAELDIPRIVSLTLDRRPIAFLYYHMLEGRMYFERLGFDPDLSQYSPGALNMLDALELASAEGATRVEFLGGAEPFKLELADRLEPLYQGFGLAGSLQGRVAVAGRQSSIRVRKVLKRSSGLRRFYYEGLAPARQLLGRLGDRPGRNG